MALDVTKYFTKKLVIKLAKALLEEAFLPMAREFVADTSNTYDDAGLSMVESFLKDFIAAQEAA